MFIASALKFNKEQCSNFFMNSERLEFKAVVAFLN